jgi:hypothetical protein
MKESFSRALNDPQALHQFIERYQIQTVVFSSPALVMWQTQSPHPQLDGSSLHFEDPAHPFFSPADWALVEFDDKNLLYVKRTIKNAEYISKNEFKILRPTISPFSYFMRPPSSEQEREEFLGEVDRCLQIQPENIYCQGVHAFALSISPRPEIQREGYRLLVKAYNHARSLRPLFLSPLEPLFAALGDRNRAESIQQELRSQFLANPGYWNF